MSTFHLTSEELLLVYITLLARDEESHPEYFTQWFNDGGKNRLRDLFNSLKEKGVILKSYNPDSYIPNEIEFNKNFFKSWFKSSLTMGKELLQNYPDYIDINGKKFLLKDFSKRFASIDDFCFFYSVQIGHNREKHEEILKILNWARESDIINFGILNFVTAHQWDALKKMKQDNPVGSSLAKNICTIDE